MPPVARHREHLFFSGFAFAAACTVFAGFARTFYLRPYSEAVPLPPLVVVHGLLFTGWILLLLFQTTLVATGRTAVHRRLGLTGIVLLPLMVIVGYLTAIMAVRRGFIAGGNAGVLDPLAGLALSLRDLLAFAAFAAAGLYYRRQNDSHKRLMALATVNLLPAAVGRIPIGPGFFAPLLLAFVLAGPVYDRVTRGRVHRVYLWGAPLIVLTMLLPFPIGRTEAWHRLAGWLTH